MKIYFENVMTEERKMLMPILSKAVGSGKVFLVTYMSSGRDYRGGAARYEQTCYFIPTEAATGYVEGRMCGKDLQNNFTLPSAETLTSKDFNKDMIFYSSDRSLKDVKDTGIVL